MKAVSPLPRPSVRRGNSIVEFAVCLPLALYLLLGAADFGRFYVEAAEVEALAQSRARLAAADDRGEGTAVFSECAGLPALPGASVDAPCPDGAPRSVYVRATVERSFQTIGRYPGVSAETTIRREAALRVR